MDASRPRGAGQPRRLGDTAALAAEAGGSGAIWRLEPPERQLDANVIRLPAGELIDMHDGPELDVLLHVVAGAGHVLFEDSSVPMEVGSLVWLPRRSRRAIVAGAEGLVYLSVHPRKPGLSISFTTGAPGP